jgi:hypothetical protein
MTAKHSKNHGLSFSLFKHYLGKWCSIERDEQSSKFKVYFDIQTIDDYKEFISTLVREDPMNTLISIEEKENFLNNIRK